MYSREETKKIKEEFWTTFGQYMSVVPSADMDKVNWVNYKTGVKHLYFKMDADSKKATVAIEMTHPDEGIRSLMFEQLLAFKTIFHGAMHEKWEWNEVYEDSFGKTIAAVYIELSPVSIFKKEDWPVLITFFKTRIIGLDEFWSTARYAFDIFK